jgi:type IV pilus assembly protein PilA
MQVQRQHGFTLIELLIVVAIISVLATLAFPVYMSAKKSSNEASAIASMKAIRDSQVLYGAAAAQGGFAPGLPTLAAPCPGGQAPFLSPDLTSAATVQKSGFTITMVAASGAGAGPTDCNGAGSVLGYYATAVVANPGVTGNRAFAVNVIGTTWEDVSAGGANAPTEAAMLAAPTATVRPAQ